MRRPAMPPPRRLPPIAAAANVSRLRDLESFKRVIAPFSGVITARNTRHWGTHQRRPECRNRALFRIADVHKLRIYVQVPEAYAAATAPGLEAELRFAEQPRKTYAAKTARTSNALDPTLRTLQVELELDNANQEVFPGAYAEVHFKLPANAESLRLPANTVLFRSAGLQVATVGDDKRVKLKSIVQGRDFGNTIRSSSPASRPTKWWCSIHPTLSPTERSCESSLRPPQQYEARGARPQLNPAQGRAVIQG